VPFLVYFETSIRLIRAVTVLYGPNAVRSTGSARGPHPRARGDNQLPKFTDRFLAGLKLAPGRKIGSYSTANAADLVCA
jgi:hypothetical protein